MERKLQPFNAAAVAPPLRPECRVKRLGSGTPIAARVSLNAFEAPCLEKDVASSLEDPCEGLSDGKSGPSKGKLSRQKASHCRRSV